jgi:hypothetical protein
MVKLKVDDAKFQKQMRRAQSEIQNVIRDAHQFFVNTTPIRTGNARNRTSLVGNTIIGLYPYAQRLDEGYSKQAPQGMVGPTLDHIERTLIPEAVRRTNNG